MSFKTMLLVDPNGNIINRVVVSVEKSWTPPEGHVLIEDDQHKDIGGTYIDGVYTPPPGSEPDGGPEN